MEKGIFKDKGEARQTDTAEIHRMQKKELKEVVDLIEAAFKHPNRPVGELLLQLRSNAAYRKLAIITLFDLREREVNIRSLDPTNSSSLGTHIAAEVARVTAVALEPQPACSRIGIHMVPVGMRKCQLCGKEID